MVDSRWEDPRSRARERQVALQTIPACPQECAEAGRGHRRVVQKGTLWVQSLAAVVDIYGYASFLKHIFQEGKFGVCASVSRSREIPDHLPLYFCLQPFTKDTKYHCGQEGKEEQETPVTQSREVTVRYPTKLGSWELLSSSASNKTKSERVISFPVRKKIL